MSLIHVVCWENSCKKYFYIIPYSWCVSDFVELMKLLFELTELVTDLLCNDSQNVVVMHKPSMPCVP